MSRKSLLPLAKCCVTWAVILMLSLNTASACHAVRYWTSPCRPCRPVVCRPCPPIVVSRWSSSVCRPVIPTCQPIAIDCGTTTAYTDTDVEHASHDEPAEPRELPGVVVTPLEEPMRSMPPAAAEAPRQLPADLVTEPAEPEAIATEPSPVDQDPLLDLLDDDEQASVAPIVPDAPREEDSSFDFLTDEPTDTPAVPDMPEDIGLDLPADEEPAAPTTDPTLPTEDDTLLDFLDEPTTATTPDPVPPTEDQDATEDRDDGVLDLLDEPADTTTDLAPPIEVEDDGTLDFLDEPADTAIPEPVMPAQDDGGLDFLDEPTDTPNDTVDITDALFPDDAPAPGDDPLTTDDDADIFDAIPDDAADTPPSPTPPQPDEGDDFGDLFDEVEDTPADTDEPATDADDDFDKLFDVDETSARERRRDIVARHSAKRALHYLNSAVSRLGNFGAYIAVVATDDSSPDRAVESNHPLTNSPVRHWTDNTGKFHTSGRLVNIAADHVRLLKENERFTTVPMRRLSTQDRQYVNSIALEFGILQTEAASK